MPDGRAPAPPLNLVPRLYAAILKDSRGRGAWAVGGVHVWAGARSSQTYSEFSVIFLLLYFVTLPLHGSELREKETILPPWKSL